MIRVLVADDHELVRLGVRLLLARSGRYAVVAETGTASEVESLARAHDAQIVLLDLMLGASSGLPVAARLRQDMPSLKILVVTANATSSAVKEAMHIGADGFLVKDGRGAELLQAMDAAMAGKRYLSPLLGGLAAGLAVA